MINSSLPSIKSHLVLLTFSTSQKSPSLFNVIFEIADAVNVSPEQLIVTVPWVAFIFLINFLVPIGNPEGIVTVPVAEVKLIVSSEKSKLETIIAFEFATSNFTKALFGINPIFGAIGYGSTDYFSATNDLWDRNSNATAIITPTVDTIIEVRNTTSIAVKQVWGGTFTEIEELEAYLIPTDPTKYTDVINYTSATGSVLIPSGLPVGTKKLIRKLNSSQGTVTITCTGETFTPSALASITLNSDGDFWLVEKVTATRWDLVDGKESGSNANGRYYKYSNGNAEVQRETAFLTAPASGTADYTFDYPIKFLTLSPVNVTLKCNNGQTSVDFKVYSSTGLSNCRVRLLNTWSGGEDGGYFMIKASGRWY